MIETHLPHKELSAGLIVVHHDGARLRMLCLRHFDTWDFPKAAVADESDALDTATAQTREATGLETLEFPWGEEYRDTIAFDDGRVSRYYLAESPDAHIELRVPAGAEAQEDNGFAWVTFDEAEDILPPRLALVLEWALRRVSTPRQPR
ncbi:MAG: hypothetical protein IT532_09300 [Burkholderiales bacterium]|nr:hypothetical protein [Burkholderiales bacterium]